MDSLAPLAPPCWHARLALAFAHSDPRTRLIRREHSGPLRLQRLLHPEGPHHAHALLLHPPGGIAGGDVLDIDVEVAPHASALITTPGAGKWYHGARGTGRQHVALRVGDDACLEWLPQEAILFDGARAEQTMRIELAPRASMFGWDIVQLGRIAAGDAWRHGHWRQRLQLSRGGAPCWIEQAQLDADDSLRASKLGLDGHAVFAGAWASSPALIADPADAVERARTVAVRHALPCGITWLNAPANLLLIRVLGGDAGLVRDLLEAICGALRPAVAGLAAQRPRIWDT